MNISCLVLPLVLSAQPFDAVTTFVDANKAYEAADHTTAMQLYTSLIEQGYARPEVYYNLGNSALRAGMLGKAVAAYRRSQKEDPRNQDTQANLDFARKSAKDALAPPAPSALSKTLFFWHYALGRTEAVHAFLIVNALFWLLLLARRLRPQTEILGWLASASGVMGLCLGGSILLHAVQPTQIAVIQKAEVEVHSGTSPDTLIRFRLHEGSEVPALGQQDGWVRIALPDGNQGWVPEADVDSITL